MTMKKETKQAEFDFDTPITLDISDEELGQARMVDGRQWMCSLGNTEAELLLLASHPNIRDEGEKEVMSGDYFMELFAAFLRVYPEYKDKGYDWLDHVYITSVVKHTLGKTQSKPTTEELQFFRPYVEREIQIVRPKLIMSLGAEAFKWLMKSNAKQSDFLGEVIDSPYGKVIPNYSPGMIITQEPKKRNQFQDIFRKAISYVTGKLNYQEFTWEVVDDPKRNTEILKKYMAEEKWDIGYDGEWSTGGKMFENGEVLHTFQYCCEPHHAIILDLSKDGKTENQELLDTMKPFIQHPKARRMGWNIRADDKRLLFRGIINREETLAFDGMKAVAFLDSTDAKGLETGIRKYTNYPPYYVEFYAELKKHGIAAKDLCALKFINPELFYRYCAGDAVSHREACLRMKKVLVEERANVSKYYFDVYLPLTNYFIDMEMYGIPIDTVVMEDISNKYSTKYEELKKFLTGLVTVLGFENFNPASNPDKKRLLYNILNLDPPYYTKAGKAARSRSWYRKQPDEIKALYQPSTNNKCLSSLKFELLETKKENKGVAEDLLDIKLTVVSTLLAMNRVGVFANKFLSKRGVVDIDPASVEEDEEDEPLKTSYWAALNPDNRIRADFYECLNNFRSSSRPNVQNPASKVLSHMPEIFVPGYSGLSKEDKKKVEHLIPRNIRHIFYGGDFLWSEVDVAGADLAIAAFLSKDPEYIHDILSGGFHLVKAREYFRDPTITKDNYSKYVSAKAITFRVAYTSELSAAATPIQSEIYSESGILVDLKEIEYALSTWKRYSKYMAYRERCKFEASEDHRITNARGMCYTFGDPKNNRSLQASQLNESLAYPIASELALFMWDLSVQIKKELQNQGLWMKKVIPVNSVHDASYWIVHPDLMKDNMFPELCKEYFTNKCRIATGDRLGMEMCVADRWKGKNVVFNKETKWDFKEKHWVWKN